MKIEELILDHVKKKSPYLDIKTVNIKNITFEERVRLQCFHCEKYNQKWTCPPHIDTINFKKVFSEYSNSMVIYCKIPFKNNSEYKKVRHESTNLIHKTLLELEKLLYNNNYSFGISFIGGSCKLCKDGCDEDKCRLPHLSRIPLEATGVNVISFIKSELDFEIKFPLDDYMYRFGLLLW
ncbi:DUF2284 domain-containing protein [Paraclostridium sordellii]|uniref:DUF2284 domain-containing protein n=1 Tax=Paraclostridium sordellii TaxID=1505 RepID=UPI0005DF4EB3|nr:DUF2284 domain-containing protein [Paeniclostridium sordellii]CEN25986.1 Predicted metal-binding protein [[Clostridium] sordellii] [Paeniclostridium sordellii]